MKKHVRKVHVSCNIQSHRKQNKVNSAERPSSLNTCLNNIYKIFINSFGLFKNDYIVIGICSL